MKNTGNQMIDQLKDNFKIFETRLNGAGKNSWHQLRKEALEIFTENGGFPKVKDEEYRYTHIGRALEKTFDFTLLFSLNQAQSNFALLISIPITFISYILRLFIQFHSLVGRTWIPSSFKKISTWVLSTAQTLWSQPVYKLWSCTLI